MREIKENVTISREEKNERIEIEDVHHLGDFSDEVSALISYILIFFFLTYFFAYFNIEKRGEQIIQI